MRDFFVQRSPQRERFNERKTKVGNSAIPSRTSHNTNNIKKELKSTKKKVDRMSRIESLVFPDDSQYRGQVLQNEHDQPRPHGYGVMVTKNNFTMEGYWYEGKTNGPGTFIAPNGDVIYGVWTEHKRTGKSLMVRGSDGLHLVHANEKKLKRKMPPTDTIHWRFCRNVGPSNPGRRVGHTCTYVRTEDSEMVVLFGGHECLRYGVLLFCFIDYLGSLQKRFGRHCRRM